MNAPCNGCPERHPRCHGECERYLAFAEKKEKERTEKAKNNDTLGFLIYSKVESKKKGIKVIRSGRTESNGHRYYEQSH